MGDILSLSKKLERAMRNGTGFSVTEEECMAMVEDDIADAVFAAKLRKLKSVCQAKPSYIKSGTTGSPGEETASRPTSRSQPINPEVGKSYIAALGFGS